MSLSEFILHTLRAYHRGKAQAITRDDLRAYLAGIGYQLTDRDLREIYVELPICSCERGLFWPETRTEIEECREYYRKAALSLLGRWRRIAEGHPELIDAEQGELFT